jgi:uncharacterized protein YqcC (DUF446 family)
MSELPAYNHPIYTLAESKVNEIESFLKQAGWWQNERLPATVFENMGAFGENTMTFQQWLQFVLIPNVRKTVAYREAFPAESMVATYAIRNLDGDEQGEQLQHLLAQFDDLFNEYKPDLDQAEYLRKVVGN